MRLCHMVLVETGRCTVTKTGINRICQHFEPEVSIKKARLNAAEPSLIHSRFSIAGKFLGAYFLAAGFLRETFLLLAFT
jgi:hypothetical protein